MRLGIVGPSQGINTNQIKNIVEEEFENIDAVILEYNTLKEVEGLVRKNCNNVDAILFTGKITYNIAKNSNITNVLMEHLSFKKSSILATLLEAHLVYGYDLNKISFVTSSSNKIKQLYKDIGITDDKINMLYPGSMRYNQLSIDENYNIHKQAYLRGEISCIVSSITSVYNKLKCDGIPCLKVKHSSSNIREVIEKLYIRNIAEINKSNQIVVLTIEIDKPAEYSVENKDEYFFALQKMKIVKEIYKFSQRIQAAIVEIGFGNFFLVSTRSIMERETNNFTQIDLLDSIRKKKSGTISMGIGFGRTAIEAKQGADMGKYRAKKNGGDSAYVVYEGGKIVTLNSSGKKNVKDNNIDKRLAEISKETGLGINTIFKLYRIKTEYRIDEVTPKELARLYGITLRSINKILNKLEQSGYLEVVSYKQVGEIGRPSRIVRILF